MTSKLDDVKFFSKRLLRNSVFYHVTLKRGIPPASLAVGQAVKMGSAGGQKIVRKIQNTWNRFFYLKLSNSVLVTHYLIRISFRVAVNSLPESEWTVNL